MTSNHGKMRMNADGDRISSLPDELIHKIVCFLNMKEAIETSVLSMRWRFVWTSMPHLNFSSEGFPTLTELSKFIRCVMSRIKTRNNLTRVYSVKLNVHGSGCQSPVKRILDYLLSHNIQQLDVVVYLVKYSKKFHLPFLPRLRSQSLKHLSLTMQAGNKYSLYHADDSLTSTLNFPMLTTLDLDSGTFCVENANKCIDAFSKFVNLRNLTLKRIDLKGSDGFNISHSQLTNLTLDSCHNVKVFNVDTPQLKSLIIRSCHAKLAISAPDLATLICKGYGKLNLSTDGFPILESAHICFQYYQGNGNAQEIVYLLQQLQSAKFLTLSLEIAELLSSSAGLLLPQPSPFVNLKILKIYPETAGLCASAAKKLALSTELKSYLLDGSPGATLTVVLREEIKAQKHMNELGLVLEKENDDAKTRGAHQDRAIIPKSEMKKLNTVESLAQTKSYQEKLGVQIEKARLLNSKLQAIAELLIGLPASHRDKLQPRFSSLSAEADNAISKIIDCMKIQCDENRSRSSDSFYELATALGPSS